jgi:hypothetical protein
MSPPARRPEAMRAATCNRQPARRIPARARGRSGVCNATCDVGCPGSAMLRRGGRGAGGRGGRGQRLQPQPINEARVSQLALAPPRHPHPPGAAFAAATSVSIAILVPARAAGAGVLGACVAPGALMPRILLNPGSNAVSQDSAGSCFSAAVRGIPELVVLGVRVVR